MTAKADASAGGRRTVLWVDVLAGIITTGIMSGAISGLSTARSLGLASILAAPSLWLANWARAFVLAWPLAFIIFWVVAPRVRRQFEKFASGVLSARGHGSG